MATSNLNIVPEQVCPEGMPTSDAAVVDSILESTSLSQSIVDKEQMQALGIESPVDNETIPFTSMPITTGDNVGMPTSDAPVGDSILESSSLSQSIVDKEQMQALGIESPVDNETIPFTSMSITTGDNVVLWDKKASDVHNIECKSKVTEAASKVESCDFLHDSEGNGPVMAETSNQRQENSGSKSERLAASVSERFDAIVKDIGVDQEETLMEGIECIQPEDNPTKNEGHLKGNGNHDNNTTHTDLLVKESNVNMVELITPSTCLQAASEVLQDAKIWNLQQKTQLITGKDLPESKEYFGPNTSPETGALFIVISSSRMEASCTENQNVPGQSLVLSTNKGVTHGDAKQDRGETKAAAVGMMGSLTKLTSTSEREKYEHEKEEEGCTAGELMHEAISSVAENLQDCNPLLLHEGRDQSCNNSVALITTADIMESPTCLPSTSVNNKIEEKEDKNNSAVDAIDELLLPSASEAVEETNMQEVKDKACSIAVMLSSDEICQETWVISPKSSDSQITNDSETQESTTDIIEMGNGSFMLINKVDKNSWYAEKSLKGLTYQEVQNICKNEFVKRNCSTYTIAPSGIACSESKENQNNDMQISTLLKEKTVSDQKPKDASTGTTMRDVTNQGMNSANTGKASAGNATLPIFDKDLLTWAADTKTTTANVLDEPATDFTDRGLVPTSENSQVAPDSEAIYSSYLHNQLPSSRCFSCPLLDSWNEHSGDEFDLQQFVTAEGSPEEKKELEMQRNSFSNDPKISMERNQSDKVRRPLCNLFAEDSVSDSEERATSTEQESGPLMNPVQEVWTSPSVVNTPSRDKQRVKSFFRHCICLPAVH